MLNKKKQNYSKKDDGIQEPVYSQEAKDKLAEQIREFDEKLKFEREKLKVNKEIKRTSQQ